MASTLVLAVHVTVSNRGDTPLKVQDTVGGTVVESVEGVKAQKLVKALYMLTLPSIVKSTSTSADCSNTSVMDTLML